MLFLVPGLAISQKLYYVDIGIIMQLYKAGRILLDCYAELFQFLIFFVILMLSY